MVVQKESVYGRVASVVGVPSATPPTPRSDIKETPPKPPKRPQLKRVRITKERGDLTRSGYIYKAMTNLGDMASQLNYNVVQRGPRGEEVIQKVTNKQTTPEGEISGTVSELVYQTVPSNIHESKKAPVRVPKVYIKWEEQQIGEEAYVKGQSPGYFAPPHALPIPPGPGTPVTVPPSQPSAAPLPEVRNIRTTELRPDFARLEWDGVRMPGIAYKVWLDGVAKGAAVSEPMIDLAGLAPGKRYKVEIRTQPYSKSDLRSPSKKVTYYFTTPRAVTVPPVTALKTIKIRSESIGHKGTIYKAETDLGANVSQFKYEGWQTIGRLTEQIEVKGKETTNYGVISFTIPYSVQTAMERRIAIKWREQEIAGQRYKAGWTEGVVIVGTEPPKPPTLHVPAKRYYFDDDTLRCKEIPADRSMPSVGVPLFTNRGECQIALSKHKLEARREARKEPAKIARPRKRKLSARVEELMKKRGFPRAVKEAIEKGLERKEAPQDIERIIEKVAKTNVPDYILQRTTAKRMARGGVVQYKADTDKGTIIYENADEKDTNAILGIPTQTGEVIPLQIKVIR